MGEEFARLTGLNRLRAHEATLGEATGGSRDAERLSDPAVLAPGLPVAIAIDMANEPLTVPRPVDRTDAVRQFQIMVTVGVVIGWTADLHDLEFIA